MSALALTRRDRGVRFSVRKVIDVDGVAPADVERLTSENS